MSSFCFVNKILFGIFPIGLAANHGGTTGSCLLLCTNPVADPAPQAQAIPTANQGFWGANPVRIFSGLEPFCSVLSSAGKYFRGEKPGPALWRPQNRSFAGGKGKGGASGLLPSQGNHSAEPQCPALGHNLLPVLCNVPKSPGHPAAGAEDGSNCLPSWLGCPNHRCWCL